RPSAARWRGCRARRPHRWRRPAPRVRGRRRAPRRMRRTGCPVRPPGRRPPRRRRPPRSARRRRRRPGPGAERSPLNLRVGAMADPLRPATTVVHAGRPPHEPDQPLNAPITMASTYVAGGDLEYGRYGNPTWAAFEEALGALEGGRALAYASGMAAVTS